VNYYNIDLVYILQRKTTDTGARKQLSPMYLLASSWPSRGTGWGQSVQRKQGIFVPRGGPRRPPRGKRGQITSQ